MPLDRSFYHRNTIVVARELLGKILIHETPQGRGSGRIVETEAYVAADPANHAFGGPTARNKVMFGEPGHAYVYFIYGMHYCFNIVTLPGEAVLIRALEPLDGVELMKERRHTSNRLSLCSGPAKLVSALGMTPDENGADVTVGSLYVEDAECVHDLDIVTTTRVGIVKAAEDPLRFYIKGTHFISKK